MKRFLLFAGDNYYPAGGADDYRGAFFSADSAIASGRDRTDYGARYDWAHVAELTVDGLIVRYECEREGDGQWRPKS